MTPPSLSSVVPPLEISSADYPPVRPVVAFTGRQEAGYYDPPHAHDRAQFSYRLEGVAVVKAGARSILLPPGRGVWIPPGVVHEVACRGPAAYNALYVTQDAGPHQPNDVRVIEITPLLHALVQRLVEGAPDYDLEGRDGLIARLVIEEICHTPDVGSGMPIMPDAPRLRLVCEALRDDPASSETLDGWASRAGMSRRTFTRMFREQTGMSFEVWRQHLRMLQAITWMEDGLSVQDAAYRLGYAGAGSFTRAFVRTFGHLPQKNLG